MATEKRLIDANDLRTQFDDIPPFIGLTGGCVQQYIDKAPTVDAVEVVHGHWIEHSHLEVGGECSVCGWQFQWFENDEARYCPHCGAKMDGENVD